MKPRYVCYARVSTAAQVGTAEDLKNSIPLQLAECHAEAARQNLTKADTCEFVEPGVSGERFEDRPALQQLLAQAREGKFDVLVVRWLDRLGRESWMAQQIYTQFLSLGIQLISLDTNRRPIMDPATFKAQARYNPDELVQIAFQSVFAQMDQAKRVVRMADGKRKSVEAGKWIGSRPPFGYKVRLEQLSTGGKTRRVLYPDPATYLILLEIPRLIIEDNLSDKSIAKLFNSRGLTTTNGKPWHIGQITYMRNNPFYAGKIVYSRFKMVTVSNGKRVCRQNPDKAGITYGRHDFEHPWDWATFEAMAKVKAGRAAVGGRASASRSPLVGVLKCGYCKGPMQFATPSPKRANRVEYYNCMGTRNGGINCQPNYWPAQVVWAGVSDRLDYYFNEYGQDIQLTQTGNPKPQTKTKTKTTKAAIIENHIAALRKELNETLPAREAKVNLAGQTDTTGIMSLERWMAMLGEIETRRKQIKEEITHLEKELLIARDGSQAQERLLRAVEGWEAIKGTIQQPLQSEWDTGTVRILKGILAALFTGIYVREKEGGKRGPHSKKLEMEMVFVGRE